MRKILTAILFGLVLLISQSLISFVNQGRDVVPIAHAQEDNDWPQLQHDPQRTGHAPGEVRPPYTYLWKWNEIPFASRTQPIVADGRLFIGGLNGVMYARDAQTGAPLWTFTTQGPIRHSAAVYQGQVFFGSHDGQVYALDAAQGSLNWQFPTGGGIATAPAIADDTVYIGSTDGVFYALNTANGDLRWSYDVGAPILTSAALSVNSDTVYLGAENITAYALNTADGDLNWSTPLQGQSLADRWPVVVGDVVIFRSQSLRHFHNLLHEGDDVMDEAGAVNPNWASDWAQVRPNIVSFLTDNPDRQTMFVLDADTGDLQGPAPMLYTYGNGDPPGSPAARGEEVYTLYRARHGIQQDAGSVHVTTRYDAALGRIDLDTLDITNLTLAPGEQWQLQYRATSDEPAVLSMAGSMLFVDTWTRLGGIDVDTGELFEVANVADHWPECWTECVGRAGPMPFFDSYPFPGPRVSEGRVHRPAVIANGVIYWRVIEGGLAAIGHASSAQSEQPYLWPSPDQAHPQPERASVHPTSPTPALDAQSLADYVWEEPIRPFPDPDQELTARLEQEVQAIVNAGRLTPFFIERGFTVGRGIPSDSAHPDEGPNNFDPGNVYWFDPGELVYTLSLAYPYLSNDLKDQTYTYLQNEMSRYPPLEPLPWPPDWRTDGTRRESYLVTILPNIWPPPAPPLSTLYALWAYADATGDWDYLQNHWSQIETLFNDKKNEINNYAAISGAIGYARIAAHLGHTTQAQQGENAAVAAMTDGQDFAAFLAAANAHYLDPRNQATGLRAPVFFGLVPEVGRFLRDTNQQTVVTYLDTLTDYYDGEFLWYLTRLGLQKELGESSFHGPELAWSVFLAKTYIQGTTTPELKSYLDRPWGLGDLYHIQKLVAAIEAQAPPDFSLSTKHASQGIANVGETITYTIVIRNNGNPIAETVFLTDAIPGGLSYIPGTLSASLNEAQFVNGTILWNGTFSSTRTVTLTYAVTIGGTSTPMAFVNVATIDAGKYSVYQRSAFVVVGGLPVYLPLILKSNGAPPSNGPSETDLQIINVQAEPASVGRFEKFELMFDITGTLATHLDWPYDADPPPGLPAGAGITVDGLFSPDNWTTVYTQPAFLYQPYTYTALNDYDHLYPSGDLEWKIRFAPPQTGTWRYRIQATDASGTALYPTDASGTAYPTDGEATFTVVPSDNPGFLHVSPTDSRYFEFDDGTPFVGVGHGEGFRNHRAIQDAAEKFARFDADQANFFRIWMTGDSIYGSAWWPWTSHHLDYDGYLPPTSLTTEQSYADGDVSMKLWADNPCMFQGFTGQIPVQPQRSYRVRAQIKTVGVTGPDQAGEPYGFVVKLGGWLGQACASAGVGTPVTPHVSDSGGAWQIVTGTLTTAANQYALENLYLTLDNATGGAAYVNEVWVEEDLGNGQYGPNLVRKPNMNAHTYFDPYRAWQWDAILDLASAHEVYLKLIVLEKNDWIFNRLTPEGTTTIPSNDNFYAAPDTKVRWLHEAWWRYLSARWGYSTAVHSWELLNEGDPFNTHHYDQAQAFAKNVHAHDANCHMATTSLWHSFPMQDFWANPDYPDADYADLHAYNSTGWGRYAVIPDTPPSPLLYTDARDYDGSGWSVTLNGADSTYSANLWSLDILGDGEWLLRYRLRLEGWSGSCDDGDTLSGPRLTWVMDGKRNVVPPREDGIEWRCSTPTTPTGWIAYDSAHTATGDAAPLAAGITITDGRPHHIIIGVQNSYGSGGAAYFDAVELIAPDGTALAINGNIELDALHEDAALYTSAYSLLWGGQSAAGARMPLVRGEAGLDPPEGPQVEIADLALDTQGVWLHNLVWGGINPGGMYDLYWWPDNIRAHDLYYHYRSFRDFMDGIPLSNGYYADARASAPDGLRAWGQADHTHQRGHLWVQNTAHTWRNVVDGLTMSEQGGTITVPGVPSSTYQITWWDTWSGTSILTQTVNVPSTELSLSLPYPITDDIAVRWEKTGSTLLQAPLYLPTTWQDYDP